MRNLPFILLFCLPFMLLSQEETSLSIAAPSFSYHIQSDADTLKLPALSWILKEGQHPLTHKQLLAGEIADAKFIDLNSDPKFDLEANRAYWFKIQLTTSSEIETYGMTLYKTGNCWPFEQTYSEVKSFYEGKNGKIKTGHSGNSSPGSERDFPKHLVPSMLKFDLQPNDTIDIWCKVTMNVGCNMQVDMELIKENIIQRPRTATAHFNAQNLIRGAMIVLFFIATLLFLWFREKVYLWFLLFILASLLFGIFRNFRNEIFFLFFSETPNVVHILHTTMTNLMFCTLMYFGRVYVNTKEQFPKTHLTIGIGIVAMLLLYITGNYFRSFPYFSPEFIQTIKRLLSFVIVSSTSIGLLSLAFSRNKLAQFFSIGALLPIAALILAVIQTFVNKTNVSPSVFLIMSGGISFTMAMAMAYRFKLEIDAKQTALQEKAQAELEQSKQQQQLLLAAEQAKQSGELDAMKSNFFANVSHELRTPLTLILSPLDSLLKSKNLNNKEFTQLKTIQQNGQDLLKLTNEILDLTKLESSKIALKETPVALYPFIQRLVGVFETYAQKKNINLSLEYTADPQLQVNLDKNKTEKVVNNLLSNAMKFTPSNGSVQVRLSDQGHSIQLEVQDTGRGIHPDDLPHIFNRFYQSKQPNAMEGGTGIGLAMVQEFAKLFGGSLTVESDLDKGSTFTFTFPKKQVLRPLPNADLLAIQKQKETLPNETPTKVQEETKPNKPNTETPTILVVEDNQQLRSYIQLLLSETYQVFTAENGQDALDWLNNQDKDHYPDLIISDVMMPIMDGFQLLKILKESDQHCSIPVVMLTARVELEDKLTALRIGVDDYMIKPFVEEELIVRVENLLANAKARKQFTPDETPKEQGLAEQPTPETHENEINQEDLQWLAQLEEKVLEHFADSNFNLDRLSEILYLSPRQIRRRLKQLTGLSFKNYLNEVRFSKARQLLEQGEVRSIKQLSADIGMKDVKYFSKQFKAHFGKSPSAYLE